MLDQHRDVPAIDGHADRTQLQDSLDELHLLVDRLSAMKPEYEELLERAQPNLQDA